MNTPHATRNATLATSSTAPPSRRAETQKKIAEIVNSTHPAIVHRHVATALT